MTQLANPVRVFPYPHSLLAVIHAESRDQVLRNMTIARTHGADGVFLINHAVDHDALVACYAAARQEHPDWWIGLNFTDLAPEDAMDMLRPGASALWTDNAGIDLEADDPCDYARLLYSRWSTRWAGSSGTSAARYFGGVAFKGQKAVADPGMAACMAKGYVDIITTSGPATGCPPSADKIRAMREALEDRSTWPLAVASGITPENVGTFLPYVDHFLVATGISDSHTELNAEKTRHLADLIHAAA